MIQAMNHNKICPICKIRKRRVAFCNQCWRNAESLPLEKMPKSYRFNAARVEMYRQQMTNGGRLQYQETT